MDPEQKITQDMTKKVQIKGFYWSTTLEPVCII